jgi:hypothetical protein
VSHRRNLKLCHTGGTDHVGLALGILLIGITGAFFFRNDAPSDELSPRQLTSAESLDRRIDRNGAAPYAATDLSPETQPALASVPEVAASDIVPGIPDAGLFGTSDPLPEPLRPESGADVLAPLPKPDALVGPVSTSLEAASPGRTSRNGSRSLTSTGPRNGSDSGAASQNSASEHSAATTRPASQPALRIHEVAPGDNLSTLAQKYLGSQSRYLKLYEANRDVLKSPDDLRVGMRLKIPASGPDAAPASSAPVAPATLPDGENVTDEAPPRITKKPVGPTFVKPAKSPVVPHGRQTSDTGKSVGQIPPPDLPEVEGLLPEAKPAVIASRPDEKN